jgi:hypothetical protein
LFTVGSVTAVVCPSWIRRVTAMSAGVSGAGATNRSAVLVIEPSGVVTLTRPEVAVLGTVATIWVGVTEAVAAIAPLSETSVSPTSGKKLVPVMVTVPPGATTVGEMPEMVGTTLGSTTKADTAVAVPPGAVTVTGPVVAPAGTVTVSDVSVASVTVAAVPLNFTVVVPGWSENPVPRIRTVSPGPPRSGVTSMTDTSADGWRVMPARFPATS